MYGNANVRARYHEIRQTQETKNCPKHICFAKLHIFVLEQCRNLVKACAGRGYFLLNWHFRQRILAIDIVTLLKVLDIRVSGKPMVFVQTVLLGDMRTDCLILDDICK